MLPQIKTTHTAPVDHAGRIRAGVETVVKNRMKEELIEEIRGYLLLLDDEERRELLIWMREEFQKGQKEVLGVRVR